MHAGFYDFLASLIKGIESLPQIQIFENPYIFATKWCKPLIFQI